MTAVEAGCSNADISPGSTISAGRVIPTVMICGQKLYEGNFLHEIAVFRVIFVCLRKIFFKTDSEL
jgi:hypothetical protein